ncbi:keratin, type 1 cytoskeletal 11-like isoform X2 [Symsagittifera roscoffensis]|uniref:keratin, type 1 cytoskeletal 11-like isoform X2 n=1 Tax=Symsagittifera roscoffensis TaxID=84072 RepID=UPI00307C4416
MTTLCSRPSSCLKGGKTECNAASYTNTLSQKYSDAFYKSSANFSDGKNSSSTCYRNTHEREHRSVSTPQPYPSEITNHSKNPENFINQCSKTSADNAEHQRKAYTGRCETCNKNNSCHNNCGSSDVNKMSLPDQQANSLPPSPDFYDEHFNKYTMDSTPPSSSGKVFEMNNHHYDQNSPDEKFASRNLDHHEPHPVFESNSCQETSRKMHNSSTQYRSRPQINNHLSRLRQQNHEKLQPSSPEFAQYLKKIKSLSSGSYPTFQRSSSAVRVPRQTMNGPMDPGDFHGMRNGYMDGGDYGHMDYGPHFQNKSMQMDDYCQKPYSRLSGGGGLLSDTPSPGGGGGSGLLNGASSGPVGGYELDYETIQKQRRELQLLITELKDRDRELNEMVASHRRQLEAWEMDRQRLLSLEARCTKYEGELSRKNEQIKQLANQVKVCESQEEAKQCELESIKIQLQNSVDECTSNATRLRELEDKNSQLNRSVREMSGTLEELEGRERELVGVLNEKSAEIESMNAELLMLNENSQQQATQIKDLEISEQNLKKENKEWREKAMDCSADLSSLKPELDKLLDKNSESEAKILELQSQVDLLHKELSLTNERERRKDQLIDLQRSKQERTEAELSSLRQITERQQKEIAVLERSLHSAQDLLGEIELNSGAGGGGGGGGDSSEREMSQVYGEDGLLDCGDLVINHNSNSVSSSALPHSSSASGSLMSSSATGTHHHHHHGSIAHSLRGSGGATTNKKNVTFNSFRNKSENSD